MFPSSLHKHNAIVTHKTIAYIVLLLAIPQIAARKSHIFTFEAFANVENLNSASV